ncbi:MAG: cupin domain-containing protein [Candidatus Margulisbacteria bacterium]|nr:cupin domain-containing protein [Candidatus Margulisiibacteriota bacterium]MBU1617108.1 cupin domain-containing protein [Candidatus Margulisiibacteriota bacterium]
MAKTIGMIPARLGSKRVPKKNLRLIDGKPLIAYIIEAAVASGVFDEVYVNSEAEVFAGIAAEYGAKFYKRPDKFASDQANNDDFVADFIGKVNGEILVQLLPTSPLITPEEISAFVKQMADGKFDTLVSVENQQIACIYKDQPVNFKRLEPHISSQDMVPVQSYATVLMAWTYQSFKDHLKKYGFAYHGADGKTGYYVLKGLSTIDIDHEEDFALAEVALLYRKNHEYFEKKYYEEKSKDKLVAEVEVPRILKKDGVENNDFEHENLPLVNLEAIIAGMDNSRSWCRRVVNTENNSATLISQLPGEGNRLHFHPDWNEWWYIVEGQWKWEIEGKEYEVGKGDLVFIEKKKWHKITAIGDRPAVRLAVSRDLVPHVYREEK